jgi:PilZ domain
MDHRREPRLETCGPARVTVLGDDPRRVAGRAENMSGQGLRLMLAEPVEAGTALMVEWEDMQVMGEVCYCERMEAGYAVGVHLQHALRGTRELERLARRLLGEEEPVPIAVR